MNRKILFTTATLLAILGIALGLIIYKTTQPTTPQPQAQTTTDTNHHNPAIPTTTPTATDNGIKVAYPDTDQAPERPTETPSYPTQDITQPTPNPNLDRNNPQDLATEVITLYTSRTSNTDTTYQDQITTYLTEDLKTEIFNTPLAPFNDTYPIAVQNVTIGKNIKEWGIDTPARYSHYATATIATSNHGNYTLDYRIAAIRTQNGWTITDLTIDSWSINHD